MTYNNKKLFKLFQTVDDPSAQTIDENYTEVTGSKCQIVTTSSSPNIVYKFQFYARDTSTKQMLMHVKLQKSNDNLIFRVMKTQAEIDTSIQLVHYLY